MNRKQKGGNSQRNREFPKENIYSERTHKVPSTMNEKIPIPRHIFMKYQGKGEILKNFREKKQSNNIRMESDEH